MDNEITVNKTWLEGLIENAKLVKEAAEKQGMPNGYSVLFHAELPRLLGYIESAKHILEESK